MVVSALFKEEPQNAAAPGTRIIRYWLHQPTRLTDGHIALQTDGTSRIAVNMSTKGKPFEIAARARHDGAMRRTDAGMAPWGDSRVRDLLAALNIAPDGQEPIRLFAEVILAPIRCAERETAKRLSIQWEVDDRDIPDAIGLRYQVVQKAEAILNDAGLLVDQDGTVVAGDTVSATLEVSEFAAAKELLWNKLTAEERRYNCQIAQG